MAARWGVAGRLPRAGRGHRARHRPRVLQSSRLPHAFGRSFWWGTRIIVVGGDALATEVLANLQREPQWGLRPVGYVRESACDGAAAPEGCLGAINRLHDVAAELNVDRAGHRRVVRLRRTCRTTRLRARARSNTGLSCRRSNAFPACGSKNAKRLVCPHRPSRIALPASRAAHQTHVRCVRHAMLRPARPTAARRDRAGGANHLRWPRFLWPGTHRLPRAALQGVEVSHDGRKRRRSSRQVPRRESRTRPGMVRQPKTQARSRRSPGSAVGCGSSASTNSRRSGTCSLAT